MRSATLPKTIRLIAQTPGVKGLQLLAHSRGTAVLLSALCELAIQSIAAGLEPVDVQKIDNVVLLPPDIDADVARQKIELFGSDQDLISRWSAARLPRLFRERLTIYASPTDRALLFSTVLFRSRKRVGALSLEDIPQAARDYFCKWGNIDLRITRQSHRSVRSLLLRQQPGGERRLDSADPPWPYTGRN